MIEQRKLILGLSVVLTTTREMEADGLPVPLGPLYASLMSGAAYDWSDWESLTAVISREGLALMTSETIKLTEKGQVLADRLEEAVSKKA